MTVVSSEERAILEEFRTKCLPGRHPLEVVYSITAGANVEAIVRRCTVCGGVVVDRETDGRIMGQFVSMRFPDSTKVLRARLVASII